MASGIQNQNAYKQAEAAYFRGNYEQAAEILESLEESSQTNPEVLLLKGHISCYFGNFDRAQEQYNLVLENAESEEYIQCAYSGLETVQQWRERGQENENDITGDIDPTGILNSDDDEATAIWSEDENDEAPVTHAVSSELENPFAESENATEAGETEINPFEELSEDEITAISALEDEEESDEGEITNLEPSDAALANQSDDLEEGEITGGELGQSDNNQTLLHYSDQAKESEISFEEEDFDFSQFTSEEFLEEENEDEEQDELSEDTFGNHQNQETAAKTKTLANNDYWSKKEESSEENQDSGSISSPQSKVDPVDSQGSSFSPETEQQNTENEQPLFASSDDQSGLFASTTSHDTGTNISFSGDEQVEEPVVEQDQGVLSFLENAPFAKKQKFLAGAAGIASAIVVALGSFTVSSVGETREGWLGNLGRSTVVGLVGGVTSGAVTYFIGGVVFKQMKRSTGDLQAQIYAVQQGNLEAKATVYSQDELGKLATGFNQMTRVVSTTTKEAQQKAQEQEQAKEDLQRQVIRLLDDVEGAARGDLTVQAEVSADVLGAVADAFNLTIRNLRTIVQQVKEAAQQVNQGAAESESFAQGLSEDALRQAEELAVSLNSAQMMTDSIQRVADNAKEAEAVARSASETALKGGEAVDSTVAGILQIRETVAQSTRKVKRLAESSQEISKIVSVISQIATRTNNLALNASIEAARAGEAGRGFAVIADEVRQLADRSTKSLREIEKIVLQIQSETSSVMIAMEEGTQQVIEGTERAEQAKNALEEIIQVSNRIDSLVQSITADTVEQSETAQSVAQVMQSVEMTAQGTSQESQQVSSALQNLVSLAGDLLASVERFRVNPEDNQTDQ